MMKVNGTLLVTGRSKITWMEIINANVKTTAWQTEHAQYIPYWQRTTFGIKGELG